MQKISSLLTTSLFSMVSAVTFFMSSSAANAQVVPFDSNAVIAITSDSQSFLDGDGMPLVNTANGTIRLQDAGADTQAYANMNLSIHLASGQTVLFNYIAQAPRGGSSRPRQLPGVSAGLKVRQISGLPVTGHHLFGRFQSSHLAQGARYPLHPAV